MGYKRKFGFSIALTIALLCHGVNAQRVGFQSWPFEVQADEDQSSPFRSEHSGSFGKPGNKNEPSRGLFSNAQNGFQRDHDFGNFGRDEQNRRDWNRGDNALNHRGNGRDWSRNEEKSQGFGTFQTQQPKKNSGANDSPKWNNGFQNTGSVYQANGNSYSDFDSNRKKNNGFGTNSGWKPGIQAEDSGNQVPGGKRIPGDKWNTNQNNWNSGFNSDKKPGASQPGTNPWELEDTQRFPNVFKPFQTNIKPGSNNAGTNQWNTTPKPGKVTKKPPKGSGNDKIPAQKPGTASSNSKPGTNVDWTTLEKQNKESNLNVDLSQLWYPTDRKNSNQNTVRNKKRNVSSGHRSHCYCVEYDECDPGRRVDASRAFGSDSLRSMLVDCAKENKVCCLAPSGAVSRNSFEIQGTNLRPTCGKRISKRTPNDETEEGLASYGDFPWMLRLISLEDDESEKTLCSASLIHGSVALTTASCAMLLTGDNIRVRAGEWNVGTGHESNKIQEVRIGKVYLHPQFDFVSFANDLALILLDEAFDPNLGTNSVCLPSSNDVWDSSRCVVSGWFKDDAQGTDKLLLSKIDLTNVVRGKCANTTEYADSDTGREDSNFFCAHARTGDPCLADAGALMCPLYNSDMLVLVGFLSRSGTCNEFYRTGTFIDLMESVDWITHMEGIYLYFRNGQLQQ